MCDSWRTEFAHHGVTVTCIPSAVGDAADGRARPRQPDLPALAVGDGRAARQGNVVRSGRADRAALAADTKIAERERIAAPDLERLYFEDRERLRTHAGPDGPSAKA